MHNVNIMAKSTIIENIFQKKIKTCQAILLTYPLEVDIIFHIFSVIVVNILSESEFWISWIKFSLTNTGIRSASSIYHGTHN